MSSRSSRVIVLLACGTSLAGLSATPAAQRQPAPVFRAGVQLLLVDVVVRDQEDEVYMPRGGSTVTAVATIRSVADEVRHRVALDLEPADRKPSGRASTDACRAAADEAARWAGRDDGFVTPYGRGAWISVWADRPFDWEDLNQRIVRAYRLVAGKRMLRASTRKPDGVHSRAVTTDAFWLTTARLGLRRLTASDFDWYSRLFRDPDVMRHVGGPFDEARIAELFRTRVLEYYARHPGLGIWLGIERQAGTKIGLFNLNHIQDATDIQVGFFLAADAWGRGYASEMASALVTYGFVDLALPRIVAITGVANAAAQRVLAKAGLRREGERSFPAYAFAGPQAWFVRDRDDWLQAQSFAAGSSSKATDC